MIVAFGETVLRSCHDTDSIDGIGRYTLELRNSLNGENGVQLRPYTFHSDASSIHAGEGYAGRYGAQALASLALGSSFTGFNSGVFQGIDLIHATDHMVPKCSRKPVVATIMDAIPIAHPEWVSYRFKKLKNALWARSVRWATHVITISEYSRRDIIHWFNLPPDQVTSIPLGVSRDWFNLPAQDEIARVRGKYSLPEQYFLFVGTIQPRKNLARVIDAHNDLPSRLKSECPLVIVGRHGWGCDLLAQELQNNNRKTVHWLKRIPDYDLHPILADATALVFASLSEGFGLPVLEAFASQTPVITSKTTSLEEIAADAAMLVDPGSTKDITKAMYDMVTDSTLSKGLIALGTKRAQEYTWERTARETLKIYKNVLLSN